MGDRCRVDRRCGWRSQPKVTRVPAQAGRLCHPKRFDLLGFGGELLGCAAPEDVVGVDGLAAEVLDQGGDLAAVVPGVAEDLGEEVENVPGPALAVGGREGEVG